MIGGDFLEHGVREILEPSQASAERVPGLLMVSVTDAEVGCGNIYAAFFPTLVSEKELEL